MPGKRCADASQCSLRRRFEQNQEDCTFTVLAILPTATENILEALPVEQILAELQRQKAERLARSVGPSEISTNDLPSEAQSVADDDGKSTQSSEYIHASQVAENGNGAEEPKLQPSPSTKSKKSKAQLWNDMKIQSIARAFTLIYTLSLLTLLTRIQLNLLGRRNYLASVVSLASPPTSSNKISLENRDDDGFESNAYGNDFETNRKYLSFSWWLLHRGCRDIMDRVTNAVKEIFGPLNPREDISLEKLSELTVLVRKRVEGFTEEERRSTKWLPYLLPPPSQEDYVLQASGMTSPSQPSNTTQSTPFLRRLLDETSDLIDSPAFTHVLTLLLDSAFSLLIDSKVATLSFKIPPISESTARVQEIVGTPSDQKCKVANTLAVFTRQAHSIGSGSTNEYLAAIEGVRDLEAFAAVVYSSNFEFEAPEASAATPATAATSEGVQNYSELSLVPSVATTRPGTATDIEMTPASLLPRDTERDSDAPDKRLSMMTTDSDLERAWGKALAREDGMQRV